MNTMEEFWNLLDDLVKDYEIMKDSMKDRQKGAKHPIYLLTGAAGFLGSNISRSLIEQGEMVRALVLPNDPAASQVPKEAEVVLGNLLDIESLERFFSVEKGIDIIVIHCASMVTVSDEFNQRLYDINVRGTRNILNKCLEHKVKKLVYVSSTSAIPELPHGQVIKEIDYYDHNAVIGHYGKSKALATQLVKDVVQYAGLDASIVFPSGICGPNDYAYGYYSNAIIDIVAEKMPAGIAGSFNAVDVRDLAEGIIACTEKGRKGEGYILSNNIVTIDDIFELVTKYTGAKRITTIMPLSVARGVAYFSEIYGNLTKTETALTSFAVYNLARNNDFSSEKAAKELGYKTRSFDETIRDTIVWLDAEGKLQLKEGVIEKIKAGIKESTSIAHRQFKERHAEATSKPDITDLSEKIKQADGVVHKAKAVLKGIHDAAQKNVKKEKQRREELLKTIKTRVKS